MVAALGDVLQELARPGFDLSEVLHIVVDRAARLCGADAADVALPDGDAYRIVAAVGIDPEFERRDRELTFVPGRGTVIGRALLEGQTIQIADVQADPEYELQDVMRVGGYHSVLGVPLTRGGATIGVMTIMRNRVAPFSDLDVELVTLFAAQAAIAIHVASLMTQTREALERESAVGHVLASIARSTFDLQKVLDTVTESAVRLSRAETGNLVLVAEGQYRIAAAFGQRARDLKRVFESVLVTLDRGSLAGRVMLERRTVQIPDVLADPEYERQDMQEVLGFRTLLGVPLMREGAPTGVLIMQRNEVRPFSHQEVALVTTFADQAALAIANVQLFETVERQRTELARFAPQVAGLLSSPEGEALLAGHRREITALFCDLRGFTPFAETAEPEELFSVLRQYHGVVGEIAVANGGTVEHFAGDGLMIFFNDPTPLLDHPLAAVRTAVAMRDRFADLAAGWRKRGYELGLGIGIGVGYATLGRIGFEGRYDYAGVGVVVTLASRLSTAAAAGEILISQRLHAMVEDDVEAQPAEDLSLKGFTHAVTAYRVAGLHG